MNAEAPMVKAPVLPANEFPSPRVAAYRTGVVSLAKYMGQFMASIAIAALSYFLVSHYVLQSVQIVGVSMQPTLRNSEHYLLNRWIYYFRSPRPGDIVVIRDPVDNGFSVKRIIASEGHTVSISDGTLRLDGSVVKESYLVPGTRTFPNGSLKQQDLKCGKGQFAVLGDNRMNSADSRVYGPIPKANILGIIIR
jgi:signal peptidase I